VLKIDQPLKVREVIELVSDLYNCREMIFDEKNLRPYVNIILNKKYLVHLNWLDTEVKDDDELVLYDPISGG